MNPGRPLGFALAIVLASSCAPSGAPTSGDVTRDDAITVAAFDFPESALLAEVYAQALERAGLTVIRQPALGPRELVIPALERGLIEVVPEYQGSVISFLGGTPPADAEHAQQVLAALLADRGLTAATAAPAQDRNVFVVTANTAMRLELSTISDLRPVATSLRFGGPPECPERPLCLAGLADHYGLRFESFVPLDAGGPLTLQGLHEGFVDIVLLFSTDPALASDDLLVLHDDRSLQPSERVVPIWRTETEARFGPAVREALDAASIGLTTQVLRSMNAAVAGGTLPTDVASDYLDGRFATVQD